MAANTGLITSDPIESLERASKLNLIGGGALLIAAAWLLYKQNDDHWPVPSEWIVLLIIGAVLLALASAVLRIVDGYFRYRLTKTVIELTDLTPKQRDELLKKVRDMTGVHFLISPIKNSDEES
jgi:RsiW-degrading membrane proteinase PrsW (M82 family)